MTADNLTAEEMTNEQLARYFRDFADRAIGHGSRLMRDVCNEAARRICQQRVAHETRAIHLPVITEVIRQDFCGETFLIDNDKDGKPQWTQEAVDFACMLKGSYAVPYDDGKAHNDLARQHMNALHQDAIEVKGKALEQAAEDTRFADCGCPYTTVGGVTAVRHNYCKSVTAQPTTKPRYECEDCRDTGQIPVDTSGSEADGNAMQFEPCACRDAPPPSEQWVGACVYHGGWTGPKVCPKCMAKGKLGEQK